MGIRKINLVRLAHVYYTYADIDKALQFLDDFGFQKVTQVGQDHYFRGTGAEPFVYCSREGDVNEFSGAVFVVQTKDDLEYASRTLPEASDVYELD